MRSSVLPPPLAMIITSGFATYLSSLKPLIAFTISSAAFDP